MARHRLNYTGLLCVLHQVSLSLASILISLGGALIYTDIPSLRRLDVEAENLLLTFERLRLLFSDIPWHR